MDIKIKNRTHYIVSGSVIAAIYVALTFISSAFGLAYGPIQFRLSEALCILPVFTPAAIGGLTVGCLISNIFSFNMIDMLFGTAATLTAALLTRFLSKIELKFPILPILPPVIINGIVIGLELAIFYATDKAFWIAFLYNAFTVALGEATVLLVLGVPLFYALKKRNISI